MPAAPFMSTLGSTDIASGEQDHQQVCQEDMLCLHNTYELVYSHEAGSPPILLASPHAVTSFSATISSVCFYVPQEVLSCSLLSESLVQKML